MFSAQRCLVLCLSLNHAITFLRNNFSVDRQRSLFNLHQLRMNFLVASLPLLSDEDVLSDSECSMPSTFHKGKTAKFPYTDVVGGFLVDWRIEEIHRTDG